MNAGSVFMGLAGLLASVVASMLSARYGQSHLSGRLFVRIRNAAKNLVSGKELDSFFSDYRELLTALGQILLLQCLALLIFTVPMTSLYLLSARCYDYFDPSVLPDGRVAAPELAFALAFFTGSVCEFFRRRS